MLGSPTHFAALIILNGPTLDSTLLNLIWSFALPTAVVCADGAANLLYNLRYRQPNSQFASLYPTAIVGDLDSVLPDVVDFFTNLGTIVQKDGSQDFNDFQKALRFIKSRQIDEQLPIVVVGGNGGRMDQTLGNLNTLFSAAEGDTVMYWLDAHNATLSLPSGEHHIAINPVLNGPSCGIIPIGGPVECVSTQGLRWNMTDSRLAFGVEGLISNFQ